MTIKRWQVNVSRNRQWKKISWAAAIGISVGIVGAGLSVHRSSLQAETEPKPYVVPVSTVAVRYQPQAQPQMAQEQGDTSQIERLKTRNRRLEALVTVLRRRAAGRE